MFVRSNRAGHLLEGHTAAVEDGQVWAVRYAITVDERQKLEHRRSEGEVPRRSEQGNRRLAMRAGT